jgi:hypothetical protein
MFETTKTKKIFGCKHQWKEQNRTFNPPLSGKLKLDDIGSDESQMILHGFTNIELECIHCGNIKVNTFIGKTEK